MLAFGGAMHSRAGRGLDTANDLFDRIWATPPKKAFENLGIPNTLP